jgi:glycosyltransferase involved in cell wall biosynthesis
MRPTLGLVVTAHKSEHLMECLGSVAAQTVLDVPITLVADLSGDVAVTQMFRQFANTQSERPISIETINAGNPGAVRNHGFSATDCEWITYLDGDDLLAPSALEETRQELCRRDLDIASSGQWRIEPTGNTRNIEDSTTYLPDRSLWLEDPDISGVKPYLFQLLAIRRSVWSSYKFYEDSAGGEDLDFLLRAIPFVRFGKIPRFLYGYRESLNTTSNRMGRISERCTCPCSKRYEAGFYAQVLIDSEKAGLGS